MTAAIGVREHSAWAATVILTGPPNAPRVVARERIEFADPKLPAQAFHAAVDLDGLAAAERLVRKCEASATKHATDALRRVLDAAKLAGHPVVAAAVPVGARPLPTDLAKILASHSLLHAAEGELARTALASAATTCGLVPRGFTWNDVHAQLADALGITEDAARTRVTALGSGLGPPWREDQRFAAAGAWLALLNQKAKPRGR